MLMLYVSESTSPCLGPHIYLRQDEDVKFFVISECSSIVSNATEKWLPHRNYVIVQDGNSSEIILDESCIYIGDDLYVKGSCLTNSSEYFIDDKCSIFSNASCSIGSNLPNCTANSSLSRSVHCLVLNNTLQNDTIFFPSNATQSGAGHTEMNQSHPSMPPSSNSSTTSAPVSPTPEIPTTINTTETPPSVSITGLKSAQPPAVTAFTLVSWFALGCVVIIVLVFARRKLRRPNNYIPLGGRVPNPQD